MRIAHKLWASMLALLLAIVVLGGFSLFSAGQAHQLASSAMVTSHALVEKSTRWKGMTENAATRNTALAVSADPDLAATFREAGANDASAIAKLREEIAAQAQAPADQAQMKRIMEVGGGLLATTRKVAELGQTGQRDAARDLMQREFRPRVAAYLGAIDEFVRLQKDKADQAVVESTRLRRHNVMISSVVAVVVLLLGVIVTGYLVGQIRAPLGTSIQMASAIAQGDLTLRIDNTRKDEFGELMSALSHMTESLAHMVGQVRHATDSIATASSEIAQGNVDLSHRTEQTASNLEETAASLEELTAQVQQTSESAQTAHHMSLSAAEVAKRGGQVVSEVVSTMNDIQASSQKIANIIGVIDGIAFQTNILALNAAVEAARAGEQGRGFAVVASEVRSLASRSAAAAKEIKELIGASVARVESGSQLVENAGKTMAEIVTSVKRVNDIISEIGSSSTEQSQGIAEVNQAVSQLDQMTQQNSALVEQSAAAAESLREQAGNLMGTVSAFRLGSATEHRHTLNLPRYKVPRRNEKPGSPQFP